MKRPSRITLALTLALLAVAGCERRGKGGPAGAPVAGDEALKPLMALRSVPVLEGRNEAGQTTFAAGGIEGTLPKGWTAMRLGPQILYHSPDMQETLHLFGYTSEAPLDEGRQREIIVAMTEVGARAERMLGVLGSGPSLTPPRAGHPAWGTLSAFTASGPLNRVSFHYAAVAAHDALMFQLDGNTEVDTSGDATALVRSIHARAAAEAPAAEAPAAEAPAAKGAAAPVAAEKAHPAAAK